MGDKFEEHMCQPINKELTRHNGEKDMFTFHPLGFEHMPKFFRLIKKFYSSVGSDKLDKEELDDESIAKFLDTLDDESLNLIKELIEAMMLESYPDEFKTEQSKKKMSKFMANNMMDLMSVLVELNSPSSPDMPDKPKTFGAQDEHTTKSNESGDRKK